MTSRANDLPRELVIIPPVFREEYLTALRAMSINGNPVPLERTLDRAQAWSSILRWRDRDQVLAALRASNAFVTPEDSDSSNIHLQDPPL